MKDTSGTSHRPQLPFTSRTHLALCVAVLIAGCATPPPPAPTPPPPPPPAPVAPPVVTPPKPAPIVGKLSHARTPREYRKDAASHLYERNTHRIYAGKMPPLLYAIGVLEVDIDGRGEVTRVGWMRAPKHAPEVIADIERSVRAAAPFPVPAHMGRVTYTDTWLWDKSGRFQLDTLTEGQR